MLAICKTEQEQCLAFYHIGKVLGIIEDDNGNDHKYRVGNVVIIKD